MKTKLAGIVIICLSLIFALPASGTMGLEGEMNKCIAECHKAEISQCEGLKGQDRAACNAKIKDACAEKCACDACGCDVMKLFDLKQMVADYADLTSFSTGAYVNTASLGEAASLMAVDIFLNENGEVVLNAVKRVVTVDPITGDYVVADDTFSWVVSPDLRHILWNEAEDDVNFVNAAYKPADMNLAGLIDLLEFIGYPKVIMTPDGGIDFYQTLRNAAATLSDGEFLLLSTRVMAILSNSMTLAFAGYQDNVILEVDSNGQIVPVDSFAKAAWIVQFLVGSVLLDPDETEPPAKPCEYSICFDRNKAKIECADPNAYCEEFYPEGCDPNAMLEAMAAGVIILPECPW
jgi:hypothetical protein